jgi:hypothetical protein
LPNRLLRHIRSLFGWAAHTLHGFYLLLMALLVYCWLRI